MGSQLVEVRLSADIVAPLESAMISRRRPESVAFGLAGEARLSDRRLLLIKKVRTLPDNAYVKNSGHGASWRGSATIPILNEALSENLAIVILHKHAAIGPVSLSEDDRASARRLLPMFQNLIGSRSHASVVFGETHASGMALLPDSDDYAERLRLRWLGDTLKDFASDGVDLAQSDDPLYESQKLLIGGRGQASLGHARVAVVGLSGGGSHVVQQLAHMGIGEIVGIDSDRVEGSNRARMIGSTALDGFLRRRKIAVMSRLVRRINRRVRFIGVPYNVPRQETLDAIKTCDVLIGCVDNYHAKADLQETSWRYLIPYIDIGLLIRPLENSSGVAIGGNVATFVPGSFCQWCIDFLSDAKLAAETGGRPRSYFEGAARQAQVVSMNGLLASQATSDVLQMLAGFASISGETVIKKFDGIDGTLTNWSVHKKTACSKCQSALGTGDPVWQRVRS
jgi:molybdopterin/thiamine biosynthesis adenylyltransferase